MYTGQCAVQIWLEIIMATLLKLLLLNHMTKHKNSLLNGKYWVHETLKKRKEKQLMQQHATDEYRYE